MWKRIVGHPYSSKRNSSVVVDPETRKQNVFTRLKASLKKAKSFDSSKVNGEENPKRNISNFRRLFSKRSKSLVMKKDTDVHALSQVVESITVTNDAVKDNTSDQDSKLVTYEDLSFWGIQNHGNTCYINSIVQCLNSIDCVAHYFLTSKYIERNGDNLVLIFAFCQLMKSLWLPELNVDTKANEFRKILSQNEVSFRSNEQQDAQEFLLFLLNYCHERLKSEPSLDIAMKSPVTKISALDKQALKIQQNNDTKIHKLFATYQQLTITCPNCHKQQTKLEPNLCLSLPVPASIVEPLYYCFIEQDGSQICAAIWINLATPIQFVRRTVAHKFRIDIANILLMFVTEDGFGKCLQDNEPASEMINTPLYSGNPFNTNMNSKAHEYVPNSSTKSLGRIQTKDQSGNIWNGLVALELPPCLSIDVSNINQHNSNPINELNSSFLAHHSSSGSGIAASDNLQHNSNINTQSQQHDSINNRYSGHYDNLYVNDKDPSSEEHYYTYSNGYSTRGQNGNQNYQSHSINTMPSSAGLSSEINYYGINNNSNPTTNGVVTIDNSSHNSGVPIPTTSTLSSLLHLIVVHVEEIIETGCKSRWRRFSAPLSLIVNKEIEFEELEHTIIKQLQQIYKVDDILSKLKSSLKFQVWDGLSTDLEDLEITKEHQFPLLSENIEGGAIPVTAIDRDVSIIRLAVIWSPNNAARLTQAVFCNLRIMVNNGTTNCSSNTGTTVTSIGTTTNNRPPASRNSANYVASAGALDSYNYKTVSMLGANSNNINSNVGPLTLLNAWSCIVHNASVEQIELESIRRQDSTQGDHINPSRLRAVDSNITYVSSSHQMLRLSDCFKAYMSEEVLDATDAWKCPNCGQLQRARISTRFYSLPDVLVIHLKRFQNSASNGNSHGPSNVVGSGTTGSRLCAAAGGSNIHHNYSSNSNAHSNNKLNVLVDYPIYGLDMSKYLAQPIPGSSSNTEEFIYDLNSVCNHQGTLSTGHYTAYCRNSLDNKWRLFNDEHVKLIADESEVVQPNAYILFYERRNIKLNDSSELHWSSCLFNFQSHQPRSSTRVHTYREVSTTTDTTTSTTATTTAAAQLSEDDNDNDDDDDYNNDDVNTLFSAPIESISCKINSNNNNQHCNLPQLYTRNNSINQSIPQPINGILAGKSYQPFDSSTVTSQSFGPNNYYSDDLIVSSSNRRPLTLPPR